MKNLKSPLHFWLVAFAFFFFSNQTFAQWTKVVNGQTPASAMQGGSESNGTPLFIARADFQGGKHPGKAQRNANTCFISWGGEEHSVGNYEVYTGKGRWAKVIGSIHSSAIKGGKDGDGSPLYIVRATINGTFHIGKARQSGNAWIPYAGKELSIANFEVLMPVEQSVRMEPETVINLAPIQNALCPSQLLGGDREFDGHGPDVTCSVSLKLTDGNRSITAEISLTAKETVHDWSETRGFWKQKVYTAPSGKKIKRIVSDVFCQTNFISGAAGFQLLFPGADVAVALDQIFKAINVPQVKNLLVQYGINPDDAEQIKDLIKSLINSGNTVYQLTPTEGLAVKTFQIVGDTGGPDISDDNNCNDDTRIVRIDFNPCVVVLE